MPVIIYEQCSIEGDALIYFCNEFSLQHAGNHVVTFSKTSLLCLCVCSKSLLKTLLENF